MGNPAPGRSETVIPTSVRERGSFPLAGVGSVQLWTARTRQRGVCAAVRLPGGVWAGLQDGGRVGGSQPGCSPTRAQVGAGALIIDGFDFTESDVTGREGQRWILIYGRVSIPQPVASVRELFSHRIAPIVADNCFVLAVHPVGNTYGEDNTLQALSALGRPLATQGKPVPGSLTTVCAGPHRSYRERVPGTHRTVEMESGCSEFKTVRAK